MAEVTAGSSHLVGRDTELASLRFFLDEAVVDGATLLLTGDPGAVENVGEVEPKLVCRVRRRSKVRARVSTGLSRRTEGISSRGTIWGPTPASASKSQTKKPRDLQGFSKRLMGLEPTTFCMAIVGRSGLSA
jgi:hypothetical protein